MSETATTLLVIRWRLKSRLIFWCRSVALCSSCLLCMLVRIWPARWSIQTWRHQRKEQYTFLCTVRYFFSLNISFYVTPNLIQLLISFLSPLVFFQKPLSWVCLWWDSTVLVSGWQCVPSQGRMSGRTLPGFFLKMPKVKQPCSQNVKDVLWKPGWLISLLWIFMKGRTWPVSTSLNMGPQRRGVFISPNIVSV